jgi:hypothetical protein
LRKIINNSDDGKVLRAMTEILDFPLQDQRVLGV